jgi:phospholipid/cholesterol/gamma-HCH transport system substrate-binding protein
MKRSLIETLLGAVVLLLAGFFVITAWRSSSIATTDGYVLKATFDKIDGVAIGTDVKISGIKVGSVTSLSLDPQSYLATVGMNISEAYRLPVDTVAAVQSEGLLGGTYLALIPGGDENMLKPGASVAYTQAAVSLTELLGKFVFSATQAGKDKGGDTAPDTDPQSGMAPDTGTGEATTGGAGTESATMPDRTAPESAPETAPAFPAPAAPADSAPDTQTPQPDPQQNKDGGFGLLR